MTKTKGRRGAGNANSVTSQMLRDVDPEGHRVEALLKERALVAYWAKHGALPTVDAITSVMKAQIGKLSAGDAQTAWGKSVLTVYAQLLVIAEPLGIMSETQIHSAYVRTAKNPRQEASDYEATLANPPLRTAFPVATPLS